MSAAPIPSFPSRFATRRTLRRVRLASLFILRLACHARSERSTLVLSWLSEKAPAIGLSNSKESALYKACAKMANQCEGLVAFARYPSVLLPNDATE